MQAQGNSVYYPWADVNQQISLGFHREVLIIFSSPELFNHHFLPCPSTESLHSFSPHRDSEASLASELFMRWVPQTLQTLSFGGGLVWFYMLLLDYGYLPLHFSTAEITYLRLYGGLKTTAVIQPRAITLQGREKQHLCWGHLLGTGSAARTSWDCSHALKDMDQKY